MRILFCGKTFPMARAMMRERLPSDQLVVCHHTAIRESPDGVDVLVPLMARIDRTLIDAGRFRLIQQFGTGLEGIDLDAAARPRRPGRQRGGRRGRERGVGRRTCAVADAGRAPPAVAGPGERPQRRAGRPARPRPHRPHVCIVGLGAVGRAVAARFASFACA